MANNNVGMTSLNKTRSTEWLLAFCAIGWGWAALQSNDTLSLPAYQLLSEIMRETAWGAVAVSIGSLRCLGLGINGWWRRSPLIRMAGSLLSGLLWMFLAVLLIASSRKSGVDLPNGVAFYPIFFAFEGWCVAAAGYDMQKNGSLVYRSA